MAFDQAVDLFGRIMRDLLYISMTSFAFDFGMDTVIKDVFIDIKESQVALFINPAYARILMTQQTVANVCCKHRRAQG
jgi:hypothetical protein